MASIAPLSGIKVIDLTKLAPGPHCTMILGDLGADIIKVFPAGSSGAPYFKELRGPLPHIPLMPTGGVTLENVAAWVQAGSVAIGVGNTPPAVAQYSLPDAGAVQGLLGRLSSALGRDVQTG